MTDILDHSRNPNPRLGVAVALHVKAPLTFEFAARFDAENAAKFKALNPTQLLPILVEDGRRLWEVDAIACRLSMRMRSDFWRMDAEMPEMIRWIRWAKANFMAAVDMVHFEVGTKQRYGLGPVDAAVLVTAGTEKFHRSAAQLADHLAGRDYLLDSGLSYADFRMASYLPYNDVAGLPMAEYPAVAEWYARLAALSHRADPFAGLDAPLLSPVPGPSGLGEQG